MSNEPRAVQHMRRLQINANKYMAVLKNDPDNKQAAARLQDMLRGIELVQFEAAAAAVKKKHAQGGVHIEVPVQQFAIKLAEPAVSE